MPSPVLGIDLGTTNSVVAYADEQRVRVLRDDAGRLITPSTVSFLGDGTILVGAAARDQRLLDVENTVFSVKRLIGRPFRSQEVRRAAERLPFKMEEGATGGVVVRIRKETYSLPEISSFILRHLREIAERSIGATCTNAVITVPANFNELQRMATRDAGRIAGLNVLRILNEPTAAALAYGYRAQQQRRIAVYDFGGGTFDISILELSGDVIEVVATAGDSHLGGDDLDRVIADRMVDSFKAEHGIDLHRQAQQYERLVMAAEWLKCQLSELEAAEATIREVASANGRPIDLRCRITRAELHELGSPLIGRTFSICEEALKLARVRPTQLDGVILVGGQTRTPRVREMVAEYFGMDPKYSVDPDLAVAQGAALQGYALSGVPAALGERKVVRTLMGPATAPRKEDDPFDDEPTRIAATRDTNAASDASAPVAKRSETPFEDLPTTITERDTDAEMTKVGEVRVTQPSVKPDGVPGTHASTLAGVGAPAPGLPGFSSLEPAARRRPESEPVTVSNEPNPRAQLGDEPIISISDDVGIEHEDEDDYELAHDSIAELEEDEPEILELPVARERVPTLAETPSAKAGMRPSRLPPDVRLTPPRPAGIAASPPQAGGAVASSSPKLPPPPSAAGAAARPSQVAIDEESELPAALRDQADEDPATTLLERPRARSKTSPPTALPVVEPVAAETEEPIRTHSMARLLASQGHIERALSIYRDLHARHPNDPVIAAEARALRGQLGSTSKPSSLKPAAKANSAPPSLVSEPSSDQSGPPAPPPSAAGPRARRSSPEIVQPPRLTPMPDDTPPPLDLAALVEGAAMPAIGPLRTLSPIPAPAPQNQQSQFPAPPGAAPLLLDVTPHTLSVETVGGFCEPIIERNAAIPTEQTRVFTTSRDNQVTVSVRVCQGESRHTDDNEVLGQIDLLGIRPARRGEVSIAVTFVIDADGTLNVRAIDEVTGHGQEIEVNLVGAIGTHEIEQMRTRQRAAR